MAKKRDDFVEEDEILIEENYSEEEEQDIIVDEDEDAVEDHRYDKVMAGGEHKYKLSGMYRDWFLDYASYVILDRAVPHIDDGLKPVQRRILHAMKNSEDGRFHKVAGIVGDTMKLHPHGDASIKDALVQLGQKNYLISTQGNWGNIYTGDPAAAMRYIEARLSKFALDVAFNRKITEFVPSYDGTSEEPVALPMKFPLLLAQGTEGIAVGLAVKILPHNFNELIDACISALKGEDFEIYPDFQTGGLADCSRYNRGQRGGRVKVRAKIVKVDRRTLSITELPFGQTTDSLIDSIIKANERGKIKIRKVDDMSADNVDISIQLQNDISPDKTIDALYAFTNCEISISPNACVIHDRKPHFMGVDEILRYNAGHTRDLFQKELEIQLDELEADWHFSSLEKIFFEKKVFRILENDAASWEQQLADIEAGMKIYQHLLRREITSADIDKLVEKPVRKISRFDIKAADERILGIENNIEEVKNHLAHLTEYTIMYFKQLKKKYGKNYPRRTELTTFETIQAEKVVVSNAKLYANKAEGFIGIDQKKMEDSEYICDCSDIAEIIVFLKNGTYLVTKVSDKAFVGKDIIHAAVFNRKDERTIYNAIYRDGKRGTYYAKRFAVTSITRDREYDLTQGKEGSSVVWFTANPNGEAETIRIYYRPRPKLKKLAEDYDFSELAIKGRGARGNIVTKNNTIHRITIKSKGVSTLGGMEIWFDTDVQRLNDAERGIFLGEFFQDDSILVICKDGTFYTTSYDLSNRYQGDILTICKFDEEKTYSVLYYDGAVKSPYIKRFSFEINANVPAYFISETKGSHLLEISEDLRPQMRITFTGKNAKREPEVVDVSEFIGKKSYRAKGKKVSPYHVLEVRFIEPLEEPDVPEEKESDNNENKDGEKKTVEVAKTPEKKRVDEVTTPEKKKPEAPIVEEAPRELTLF
ncbi:MAG: DNA gyrase/topoisomerase IV subunit A [Bacteroidales bacterium]|nr:DNA gyrase/topoisomerase IV subunit A [Bacteroidales bacterium]